MPYLFYLIISTLCFFFLSPLFSWSLPSMAIYCCCVYIFCCCLEKLAPSHLMVCSYFFFLNFWAMHLFLILPSFSSQLCQVFFFFGKGLLKWHYSQKYLWKWKKYEQESKLLIYKNGGKFWVSDVLRSFFLIFFSEQEFVFSVWMIVYFNFRICFGLFVFCRMWNLWFFNILFYLNFLFIFCKQINTWFNSLWIYLL